jgi:hypothetical protein
MKNYWSCTKFADWVRGTPKPLAGTTEEWNGWRKKAAKKKTRYWFAEEGLDYLQKFIYFPLTCIRNVCCYVDNRWCTRAHALTSNLKRGQWHEYDQRLLHSVFDELVNSVEIEQACLQIACIEDGRKKYKVSWLRSIFPFFSYRRPEAGLVYLEWAASLKHNETWADPNDPDFGKPTSQALAARELIQLYKWWKEERPKRADPMDASGWSNYCDQKRKESENREEDEFSSLFRSDQSEAEQEQKKRILDLCGKLEQEQEEEDTRMLVRLVRVRRSVWT